MDPRIHGSTPNLNLNPHRNPNPSPGPNPDLAPNPNPYPHRTVQSAVAGMAEGSWILTYFNDFLMKIYVFDVFYSELSSEA